MTFIISHHRRQECFRSRRREKGIARNLKELPQTLNKTHKYKLYRLQTI